MYEMMDGLKINFMKSEICVINGDEDTSLQYVNLFYCQIGTFSLKCLEAHVSPSRLHIVG